MQRRPARTRPAQASSATWPHAAAGTVAATPDVAAAPPAMTAERQQLLEMFEASLLEQGDLDREERDYLLDQYKAVISAAPLAPSFTPGQLTDDLAGTFALLRDNGLLAEDDIAVLERQLGDIEGTLRSSDVGTALEFARRVETEGRDAALRWWSSRDRDDAASTAPVAPTDIPSPRNAAGTSRSRSLRGPPRAR